jgi:hypothetical protein
MVVGELVFAGEVENIDGLAGVFEMFVVIGALMSIKLAVAVKDEKLRCRFGRGKCCLRECLEGELGQIINI